MVRYANPGGFNFGSANLDGYGMSSIAVGAAYSIVFYTACIFLWLYRRHPVVKMRNVPLLLLSVLTLHVFAFMVMVVYTLNGAFPCQVEFWCMNLYLPIGIGLFQAQNQQLLIVSRQQAHLSVNNERYKPLLPKSGRGIGGPKQWLLRLKLWWRSNSEEGKYQGYILVAIIIQFIVSFVIYNISRKFNHYGVVSKHKSPGLCRRGWEWAPSVIWQFSYNWIFAPYLIYKIRLIRDIYHWRLQTILAIAAGLPGTPVWLAAVYTDSFARANKYWIPAMWFVPGIYAMEIVGLGFPIYQIWKHRRAARETTRALADFDAKRLSPFDGSMGSASVHTRSTTSKRSRMYSMESLDQCLAGNHEGLQLYASCMELNGENIIFLTKVIAFNIAWQKIFHGGCNSSSGYDRARAKMFPIALSIFISLVHSSTAPYPINIESTIYNRLDAIFGPATAMVARSSSSRSASMTTTSSITPWDYPSDHEATVPSGDGNPFPEHSFPMQSMGSSGLSRPSLAKIKDNESSEHIVTAEAGEAEGVAGGEDVDAVHGVTLPDDFKEGIFNDAFKSVRFMVWTETWQRYQTWKRGPGNSSVEKGLSH